MRSCSTPTHLLKSRSSRADVREDLERYHQRLRAYRPRPRPPQLGSEMTMVYAAREGYERKLVAASTRSGVEQLAQEYVDTLRPCYEWEGFHDCPEREAVFAERYLIDHPDTAFAGFLRVLAAHRWLCAAEAYEYDRATWQRRARPAPVSKGAGHSGQSRVAVDEGRRRRADSRAAAAISPTRFCGRLLACRAGAPADNLRLQSRAVRWLASRSSRDRRRTVRLRASRSGGQPSPASRAKVGAGGRNRTDTGSEPHGILSPARLPVSPLRPGQDSQYISPNPYGFSRYDGDDRSARAT